MAGQVASDTSSAAGEYRVLVESVGTASPASSASIATGLGLPPSKVVSSLYRAPSVLVADVKKEIAQDMVTLLGSIGYQAKTEKVSEPLPEPATLYDVAIYIEDARQVQRAIESIAKFIGMNLDEAANMVMTPPGMVLGSVSEATIRAFTEHLGDGVSIIASNSKKASYHIFLQDVPDVVSRRLLEDIRNSGFKLCGEKGLILTDVNHETAKTLWSRHRSTNALKIVNSDFLRFDLVLLPKNSEIEPTTQQRDALKQIAGIPEEMASTVMKEAPITLLEAVPASEIEKQMIAFTDVGLAVRADLITFQKLSFEVLSASDTKALINVLNDFGFVESSFQGLSFPFKIQGALPELQARIIRAALEDAGAKVVFTGDSE